VIRDHGHDDDDDDDDHDDYHECMIQSLNSTAVCCNNYLTPYSSVLLEKLIFSQLVKKFPAVYRSRFSLPCSQ